MLTLLSAKREGMYHVHVMSALGGGVEGVGKNLTKGRDVVMIWYGGSLPGIRVTHKHSTQEEQPALTGLAANSQYLTRKRCKISKLLQTLVVHGPKED